DVPALDIPKITQAPEEGRQVGIGERLCSPVAPPPRAARRGARGRARLQAPRLRGSCCHRRLLAEHCRRSSASRRSYATDLRARDEASSRGARTPREPFVATFS